MCVCGSLGKLWGYFGNEEEQEQLTEESTIIIIHQPI